MSLAQTRPNSSLTLLLDRLNARYVSIRAKIAQAKKRRDVYRKTLNELNALTARDLEDIGIAPFQIKKIAKSCANTTEA